MTKKFDDNARMEYCYTLHFEEEYIGGKVKDMIVKPIKAKDARPYIASNHYSKTFPDSTLYCFAGYINSRLAGIICFGMGVGKNQYKYLLPDIKNGEYLELTRLWSPDGFPKNTESKLISESFKLLPKNIRLIISFSDISKNHIGTIYQASNFYYCGLNNGGKMILTKDGIEKHPRLLGIYKQRHEKYKNLTNKELMKILNYKYIEGGKKHRYAYILTKDRKQRKKDINKILEKSMEYPKCK